MRTRNFQALLPRLREVWRLSLPAILTQITTIAMQYIDSAMVGRLGANASAAIGLVASSTWLFNGVCYALSAGFSVQVAHRIGAGNARGARSVEKNGLLAGLLVSGLLCLLGSLIHAHLPVWLKGDAEITGDAGRYFLSFSWMLPFTQLCSLTSSFLQCAGDMLTPSILNAVMCVLDVAFNALLIPRLGVFGAGLGTMLACAVVAVVMVILCCFRNESLRFRSGEHHPVDGAVLKTALRIGTPVALQEVAMCGAQVVSTAIIAPLGALAVAANAFAVTAESICYMPGYGIANARCGAGRAVGRRGQYGKRKARRQYLYCPRRVSHDLHGRCDDVSLSAGLRHAHAGCRCAAACRARASHRTSGRAFVRGFDCGGGRAARCGRYARAEPSEPGEHLAGARGKRARPGAAFRAYRHVVRDGSRAVHPGASAARAPEDVKILSSDGYKKTVIVRSRSFQRILTS